MGVLTNFETINFYNSNRSGANSLSYEKDDTEEKKDNTFLKLNLKSEIHSTTMVSRNVMHKSGDVIISEYPIKTSILKNLCYKIKCYICSCNLRILCCCYCRWKCCTCSKCCVDNYLLS